MNSFELVEPSTLSEAFSLLDRDDPAIRPIAGGTALMLMMKAGLFSPLRLVSLGRIEAGFDAISVSVDGLALRIGAMTSLATVEHSDEIRRHFPVVTTTMRTLANPRVRNVATVGGNLAHADPHLDLPPVWIALDGQVEISGPFGQRLIEVEDLFAGYYETILRHDELITALHVPIRVGYRVAYQKVMTRAAHDWPTLGIAVALKTDGMAILDVRVALSAAVHKPTRLKRTEAILRGAYIDETTLRRAGDAAVEEVEIEADNLGSADYKKHLLRVYLGRVVRAAVEVRV